MEPRLWCAPVMPWKSPSAISAAAPAPMPLKSATIWGIAVIATRRDTTAPISPPTTTAGMM